MRGDCRGRLALSLSLFLSLSSSLSFLPFYFWCVLAGHIKLLHVDVCSQSVCVFSQCSPLCTVRVCMCVCVPNCMSFVIHQRGMRCGLRVAAAFCLMPLAHNSSDNPTPLPLGEKIVKILLEMLEMRRPPF